MRFGYLYLFICWMIQCSAFGPRRLYTLNLPTTINSVKVVGRQVIFVGPWYISVVENVQWKFMQKGRMTPRIINKDIPNPRMIGRIPSGTFKGSKQTTFWVTTWGTNDTAGAVYVLEQTTDYSEWGDISVDAGWNYERTQWVDMNRDGLRDCLTARFRGGVGQMLWFQQPPGQTIWGQKIIHEGMADGNFVGFIYDKKSYIIVAGNQFSTLGLYWTMNKRNNWLFSRQIRHRVIDNYGKYYDIQYVDLNKDGRPDILTTTIQIASSRGHVLGYEIPYDIQNKLWNKRVLAAGFTGDYSPGKAIAYFPNKWKKKSDRPSIFLSGAGEEQVFILSPTPKSSGWGYIKSSLKVGTGMIGIPYIVDLNGDSYPEIFVPQGNQVHVFSYDYSSSAASAPAKATRRTTTARPKVPYRNPFFRPTTPPPLPAIPPEATPFGPLPERAGIGGLPRRTNILGGGSESAGSSGSSSNLPYYPSLNGVPQSLQNPGMSQIPVGGLHPSSGISQTNAGGRRQGSNLPSRPAYNPPLQPVANTPSQSFQGFPQQYPPNARPQVPGGNPSEFGPNAVAPIQPPVGYQPPSNQNQVQQIARNQASPRQPASQGSAPSHSGVAPVRTNNHGLIIGPDGQWYQPSGPQNSIPYYHQFPQTSISNQSITNNIRGQTELSSIQGQNRRLDPQRQEDTSKLPVTPSNLVLSVTERKFNYHSEAADACSFERKVLCDINQLQDAEDIGGEVPNFEWGWFAMEGRAASIEKCSPGEVKWEGYVCHNGVVAHLPVINEANLPALCCSVVNWATITKKRYSRVSDAQMECKNASRHLCSKEEMYVVWRESSYKGYMWGWFNSDYELLRMTHYCDPRQILWSGYTCIDSKFEITEIRSFAQEKGFCCPGSASETRAFKLMLLLSVALSVVVIIL